MGGVVFGLVADPGAWLIGGYPMIFALAGAYGMLLRTRPALFMVAVLVAARLATDRHGRGRYGLAGGPDRAWHGGRLGPRIGRANSGTAAPTLGRIVDRRNRCSDRHRARQI